MSFGKLRKISTSLLKSGDLITLNPSTKRNKRLGRESLVYDKSCIELYEKGDPREYLEKYSWEKAEIGVINVGDVALVLDVKSHNRNRDMTPDVYWEVKIMFRSGEGTLVGWVPSESWARVGNVNP